MEFNSVLNATAFKRRNISNMRITKDAMMMAGCYGGGCVATPGGKRVPISTIHSLGSARVDMAGKYSQVHVGATTPPHSSLSHKHTHTHTR